MGARFIQAKEHANISFKDLARRSNCPVSMLTEIANGRRKPRVDSMEDIAKALGVSVGWLVYGDGQQPPWVADKQ
jgi:transcriptional regulator with XRE-family HTH domain